jgi:hypothetical protein
MLPTLRKIHFDLFNEVVTFNRIIHIFFAGLGHIDSILDNDEHSKVTFNKNLTKYLYVSLIREKPWTFMILS